MRGQVFYESDPAFHLILKRRTPGFDMPSSPFTDDVLAINQHRNVLILTHKTMDTELLPFVPGDTSVASIYKSLTYCFPQTEHEFASFLTKLPSCPLRMSETTSRNTKSSKVRSSRRTLSASIKKATPLRTCHDFLTASTT